VSARNVVILGAGQAGLQAAVSLRQEGFQGRVWLVGAEPGLPYQRPPLSKGYLQGAMGPESLLLRPQAFFDDNDVELVENCEAVAIERSEKRVALASGETLSYDHLVLALGAGNLRIPVEGVGLDGVLSLRSRADAEELRQRLRDAGDILVIGGGFIGMEVAAVAEGMGVHACVLEAETRPMARMLSDCVSDFLADAHERRGSGLLTSERALRIAGSRGRVSAVETDQRRRLAASLVLVATGVGPNIALAARAGLCVDDGIVVDRQLVTTDASISAIGDCARFPSVATGAPIRLESVQNAIDQARCVAARLVGRGGPYDAVPWFWSDQGDLKLQIVGITRGHDMAVIRGRPAERRFSVFCYRKGRLVGIESINRPADHMVGRRILGAGAHVTPEEAADLSFDLQALVADRSALLRTAGRSEAASA
jgi:3-phenylpropionate/trans-cinnamate dioxygenase ferredoxin reductase subunit